MTSLNALRGGILAPALSFLERGDLDQAFKAYRAIRRSQPRIAGLAFNFANALLARGHAKEAEVEFREALKLDPNALDILNNLASSLGEQGRHEEALALCDQGLARSPDNTVLLRTRGVQYLLLRRFDEALADANRLLELAPDMPDAHNLKGDIFSNLGRWDEAIDSFRKAVSTSGGDAQFRVNLGSAYAARGALAEAAATFTGVLKERRTDVKTINALAAVLQRMNKHQEAIRACELALSIQPAYAEAHNRMAQSYLALEKWPQAIQTAKDVLVRHPGHLEAVYNLGMALVGGRRYREAIECFDQILEAGPEDDMALLNLGNALSGAGRVQDAVDAYNRMIARLPNWAGGYLNIGHAYGKLRRWDDALANYHKAFELEPHKKDHLYNVGNVHLHLGNYGEGWKGYEYRNQSAEGVQRKFPDIAVWNGEDLSGKRILVFGEQGLGDNIQMARYLPLLQERGATVTFHGYPMLHALLSTAAPGLAFVADDVKPEDFDFQVATMSLPAKFGTLLDTIPRNIPYFKADPERVAKWAARVGDHGFRIGINWQGNPSGKIDEGRSAPLKQFLRFAEVPGVRIISMQKNHGLDQLNDVPAHIKVELLGDDFDTGKDAFLDTLAVLANVDLVVTTDTSLAHVTGGFGTRTFVALKEHPDWRWLLDREDSPWYPNHRLFRQVSFEQWDDPFIAMTEAIRKLAASKNN
jgi:tetratricopeptide (TPR) repeat protein